MYIFNKVHINPPAKKRTHVPRSRLSGAKVCRLLIPTQPKNFVLPLLPPALNLFQNFLRLPLNPYNAPFSEKILPPRVSVIPP